MKTLADAVRIDRWLWAARFFKTRSLAARAVAAGHVTVFGQHVRPAKMVQPGDLLGIRVGFAVYGVRVLALAGQRGPAAVARLLYEETPESVARREAEQEARRLAGGGAFRPATRPEKHQRRRIRQFLKKE